MRNFLRALFFILAAVYPVVVFSMLVIFRLPVKIMSLVFIGLGFAFFLAFTGKRKSGKSENNVLSWRPVVTSIILICAGLFCFLTNQAVFLKLYSVVISAIFLTVFGSTLFFPPTIIFRFATLADRSIEGSNFEDKVKDYCKKVTIVWCIFFIFNGSAAFYTALFASDKVWSIYNGGISYVLTGSLFIIEYIIRKKVDKKMTKAFPLSKFNANSHKDTDIMCYNYQWTSAIKNSSENIKTWKDFLTETAVLRKYFSKSEKKDWILHCEDYWMFLVTFAALLQSGKNALLTQNITEKFIQEVKNDSNEFITDQTSDFIKGYAPFLISIPELLSDEALKSSLTEEEIRTTPAINPEDGNIVMFTSGSTGKPKAVQQRLKEFEEDNAFIISKWADEFKSRKLITTVSQHHIYGFLFGILLPFTLGVPFRRKRIEFPEEFEILDDTEYILIATPAFLKRTCDSRMEEGKNTPLNLKKVWIFTSGGAVSPELSVSTKQIFGFCPLEVYGSTETSGIAYRQQGKDGLVWTPFDNAKVWKGDDGCLRIISPYIKNPEGFATADLVDFVDEEKSRFLLKGRSDSIVKIEEKRISMTEVENRLLETGLIKDLKVIALSNDVRQFLAAAIVLNEKGKEQFKDTEKYLINRFFHDFLLKYFENVVLPKKWRFVDELPADVQGKKHKDDIAKLFENSQQ